MTDKTYPKFMEAYAPPARPVIHVMPGGFLVNANAEDGGTFVPFEGEDASEVMTPFIVVHGLDGRTMVLNPILGLVERDSDHLCVDAHAFTNNEEAAIGVIGFDGLHGYPGRQALDGAVRTSHGHKATGMAGLIVGKQGEVTPS